MGVGGSGKQSLAKFAAFVADCDLRTVSMAAGYNLARFREEVKHVLKVGTFSLAFAPECTCKAVALLFVQTRLCVNACIAVSPRSCV